MKVELIVPPYYEEEFETMVLFPIIERYGGVSVADVKGYWKGNGDFATYSPLVVADNNQLVFVYVDEETHDAEETNVWFTSLAARVAEHWDQECVLLAYDGVHKLITPDGGYYVVG